MCPNTLHNLFPSLPPFSLRPSCRLLWMPAPVWILMTQLTPVNLCSPSWKCLLSLSWVGVPLPWSHVPFILRLVPYLWGSPSAGNLKKGENQVFFCFYSTDFGVFILPFCSVDSLAGCGSLYRELFFLGVWKPCSAFSEFPLLLLRSWRPIPNLFAMWVPPTSF